MTMRGRLYGLFSSTRRLFVVVMRGMKNSFGGIARRGVVLDTTSEGPHSLFVQIVTVFVQIVTKYTKW